METQKSAQTLQYSISPLAYQTVQTFRSAASFSASQVRHALHCSDYTARKICSELSRLHIVTKSSQMRSASGHFLPAAFSWIAEKSAKFTVVDVYNNNNKFFKNDRIISTEEFARVSQGTAPSLPPLTAAVESTTADFTAEEQAWFEELRQDASGIFTDTTMRLLLRMRMVSHKESRPAIQTLRAHVLYGILKAQDPYKAQYIKATFLRKEGRNFEAREFNTCDFTYQQCLKMVFGNTAPASQAKPPQANRAATILPGAITPQSFVEERSASETVSVTTPVEFTLTMPEEDRHHYEWTVLYASIDRCLHMIRAAQTRPDVIQDAARRAFANFHASVENASSELIQKVTQLKDTIDAALQAIVAAPKQPTTQAEHPKQTQPSMRRKPAWLLDRAAKIASEQELAQQRQRLEMQKALLAQAMQKCLS